MSAARRPARRRLARRPRLVSVGAAVGHPTDLHLWHIGLQAAGLLRRNFPAFWAANVGHLPVSRERLLAAGAALIRLVRASLAINDWFVDRAGEFGDGSPLDAITHPDPESLLSGDNEDTYNLLRCFLEDPPLDVYGVNLDIDDGDEFGDEPLAYALQWVTMLQPFDTAAQARLVLGTLADALIDLPRVDCRGQNGQFDQLCAALDAADDIPRYYGGVGLGTLLAYAHQRTDNDLANIGCQEAFDAQGYGCWAFTWEQATVEEFARIQTEAQAYEHAYQLLERTISGPIPLIDLSETIARVATAIGLCVVWPGSGDDDPYDDHNGQGQTLAEVYGAAEPA